MTSQIISETIAAEYPVAGVDNDTQGFRDNFSIIKAGLTTAKSEITILQNNTAKLNQSNDFKGSPINDAELALITEKYFNAGTKTSGDNISFLNGHYQRISINLDDIAGAGTISFNLADWPERDGFAKMTVEFRGTAADNATSEAHTVLLTADGSAPIKKSPNFPTTLIVDSVANRDNPIIIEFWAVDQGNTIFANYLGVFS